MNTSIVGAVVAGCLFASPPASGADHEFDSDGVRLRYVVAGEGAPVVLLHGITRNVEKDWIETGLLEALSAGFQVLALDQRGHGRSGKPPGPADYGLDMVRDVVRFLDHRGLEDAHIVGYSMGGSIALKLLVEHPRRVRSVALLATGGVRGPGDLEPFLALAASLEAGQGIRALIPRIWPVGQTPSAEQIEAINAETMARNDPAALAAAARGYAAWRVETEQLNRVRKPVLAVVGSADTAAFRVEGLEAVLPGLAVRTIPGADHVGLLREPQLVAAMHEFLAANSGAAPVAAD